VFVVLFGVGAYWVWSRRRAAKARRAAAAQASVN